MYLFQVDVLQTFIAVTKLLLKKPYLDPNDMVNCRPTVYSIFLSYVNFVRKVLPNKCVTKYTLTNCLKSLNLVLGLIIAPKQLRKADQSITLCERVEIGLR